MRFKIPRNVLLLGLISFFNDVASEMIYPIVPIFLTTVLGTPIPVLGFIEGIAEATASLSKFIFGYVSDYYQRRKPFVVAGYALGTLSKALIGLAHVWMTVLGARFIDRLGKGLRTAARDSMLLENTTANNKGFVFGFHRALDSLGATIGPLVALLLLWLLRDNMRAVFFWAVIPAAVGVLLLIFFVKEIGKKPSQKRQFVKLSWRTIPGRLKIFFLASFIFSAGNSSDAFMLLRAKQMGFTITLVVLVYVLYNLTQSVFATPLGSLSDRWGPKKVYAGGLIVFALVYAAFGLVRNPLWYYFIFPVYGIYIAATDGVSKAYVAEYIKTEESGTYFGLHQTLIAVAGFIASFFGGILWTVFGSAMTFWYGSLMAITAFLLLQLFTWGKRGTS